MEQIGGVGEGCDDRDAGVNAEQRFVGVLGERGEADGFQVLGVGHWAPPVFGRWWARPGAAMAEILDGLRACMRRTPIGSHIEFEFSGPVAELAATV
jgi:hypothetical protein